MKTLTLYLFQHPNYKHNCYYDVLVVATSAREARKIFEKETCGSEKSSDYKITTYWRLNRSKVLSYE